MMEFREYLKMLSDLEKEQASAALDQAKGVQHNDQQDYTAIPKLSVDGMLNTDRNQN